MRKVFAVLCSAALLITLAGSAAAAPSNNGKADLRGHRSDNLPNPMSQKQAALKQRAQELVLAGKVKPTGDNQVVKVAKGQYVQLAQTGQDEILTLLGQFGDAINPTYGGDPGPLHNQIPEPNRANDNTTIWQADYTQASYQDMLFNPSTFPSMAGFYKENSSGRYTVDGYVGDWVTVPYNEANYGADYCGDIVCARTWLFIRDQANAWWADLVAEKGEQGAKDFLATFDQQDRYDYNGDGDFNQPDGYIDHFQSIHAGEGEEVGGGAQGSDAIWSHRWYAFYQNQGITGPDFNKLGGIEIGDSGYWIGDYTIEPENGGVGVFAHEFGHDLNLPDEYDTSGNTGGAENSTGWWTIMSQGSYGSQNGEDLGSAPMQFSGWDKFQLGWLKYDVEYAGRKGSFKLGPAETNTRQAQGLFVVLPLKNVTTNIGSPYEGSHYYYTGTGDNLDTTMTRSVTLPSGTVGVTAQVRYNIEQDWDYAYLTVNGDPIPTNLSTNTSPNGQNFGEGITGVQNTWTSLTADLSAFAGQTVTIGFEYWTDGAQQGTPGQTSAPGFQVDAIDISGQAFDGAESAAGWAYAPATGPAFHVTTGSETRQYSNYYFAEYRQYRGYDKALEVSPYNFGWLNDATKQNFVEFFPYQDGLLVWYWDNSYADNNVGDHPGGGLILPVDAHPAMEHWSDISGAGSVMRPRIQAYDSTFGFWPTDAITLHHNGNETTIASKPAVLVFNDLNDYYVSSDPGDASGGGRYQSSWSSVQTPHTGTTIRVVSLGAQGSFLQVNVNS